MAASLDSGGVAAVSQQADPTDERNYEMLKDLLTKSKFLTAFLSDRITGKARSPKRKKRKTRRVEVDRDPDMSSDDEDSPDQPALLTGGTLRPYQVDGYKWLKILFKNGVNGILGDEMGLGKTIQVIALIAHLIDKNVPGHFLICAPLSTLKNWIDEFHKFAPTLPVLLYHAYGDNNRAALRKQFTKKQEFAKGRYCLPIIVTSYEIAIIDHSSLVCRSWMYVVVDEGHRIKNFDCKLFSCLNSLVTSNRLLLTGTPLQNNMAELWALLHFLIPELFDKLRVFNSWFDVSSMSEEGSDERIIKQEEEKHLLSTFHEIVSPFMLRRLKCDIDLSIPPKREFHVKVPLMPEQDRFYKAILNKTINAMLGQTPKKSESDLIIVHDESDTRRPKRLSSLKTDGMLPRTALTAKLHVDAEYENIFREVKLKTSNCLAAMRKACNHPYQLEYPLDPRTNDYLIDETLATCSGKMLVVDQLLKLLKENRHKVLIFSQFTTMLDIIQDLCWLRGHKFSRLDGAMKLAERDDQIDLFNKDEDTFVFLISTRAGGLGINLVAADTVIIYDSDWNPQCDQQAMARCHRIGQTKPVVIVRLITENTIDEKMVVRATAKRKLERMVIHKDLFKTKGQYGGFSPKELLEMLTATDCSGVVYSGKDKLFTAGELERILDRNFGNNNAEANLVEEDNLGRVTVINEDP